MKKQPLNKRIEAFFDRREVRNVVMVLIVVVITAYLVKTYVIDAGVFGNMPRRATIMHMRLGR